MATSSYFGTTNQYINYWFEAIENSQSTSNNTSSVTVRVWIYRTNGYSSYGSGTVYCTIDGTAYSAPITPSQTITSTPRKMLEKTVTIPHSADGTKTVAISGYFTHDVFSSSNNSWNFGLTTIARASQPTLNVSSTNYGSSVTITTNRASSSFTHTLRYNWNGSTANIATGVTTSQAWTVPTSLMNNIPNATSSWGTIYCDTYSGSTLIGTKTVTLTTNVPSTVVPTFTSVTHSEAVANVSTKAAAYVQNLTQFLLTCNGAAGAYGSTIARREFTVEGVAYNAYTGNTVTTGLIKGSGSITITCKIYDSRGRTATKTATATVLAYAPPKITAFTVERSNSDGTLNAMGTYVKVTRKGTWSVISTKNTMSVKISSRTRGTTTWTLKNTYAAGTGGSVDNTVVLSTYSATASHDFMIEYVDLFNTTISVLVLPTGQVTMSWAPDGIGIGKVWEQGALDVSGDMFISGKIEALQKIITSVGGQALDLKAGPTSNHVYMGFYKDSANQTVRSGWLGYGSGGLNDMNISNQIGIINLSATAGTLANGKEIVTLTEEGSSSNGRWVKYSDGTMMCWLNRGVTSQAISTAYSPGYQGVHVWTFPATFIEQPTVTCSEFKWGTSASWGTVSAKTTSSADLRGHDYYSRASGTVTTITAFAMGRWK